MADINKLQKEGRYKNIMLILTIIGTICTISILIISLRQCSENKKQNRDLQRKIDGIPKVYEIKESSLFGKATGNLFK